MISEKHQDKRQDQRYGTNEFAQQYRKAMSLAAAFAMASIIAALGPIPVSAIGWNLTTVQSSGNVGQYADVAVGTDNVAHVSYYDTTNGDLKYAKKTSAGWTVTTVASAGDVGMFTSIALDSNNNPYISYYDATNQDLRYAKRTSQGWSTYLVATQGDVGRTSSISMDPSSKPAIAYYDATNGDLKYARYAPGTVNGQIIDWTAETIDSVGNVGVEPSLTFDGYYPHISYYDATNGDLKYAKKTGPGQWLIQRVDSPGVVGQYSSVIIDQFGDIRISYYDSTNGDLKVARMATPYSNVWSTIRVDSTGTVGAYTSISHTPGPDEFGNIQVSYYDATSGNLKIAREDAWKSWSIEIVDSSVNNVGKYSAMATGSDLHIVYYDATYGDLKYAVR